MCGRYLFDSDSDIEEINKIVGELNSKYAGTEVLYNTGEIYPSHNAPILSMSEGRPALNVMKWGFPKWNGKGVIINAKSETAHSTKMFAKPLAEKRCVIPSTGFYEWKKKDASKVKDKYLFTHGNNPMLYMAGLYNCFKTKERQLEYFVILTREANGSVRDIHERMPVILFKEELLRWLKDESFFSDIFERDGIGLERQLVKY